MSTRKNPAKGAAAASDYVRGEWLRRVEAEYRSAAITQHLTLWLIQAGASPDLLHAGLRIAADELAHAELSMEVYVAAEGREGPRIARETLGLARHEREPLEHDIARTCVDVFCLGETVAVPLFRDLRDGCTVPVARRALDRILRDEVRHRDFGWTLLAWLLASPAREGVREVVARELPAYFGRLRDVYASGKARAVATIAAEDRAWGLMAPARYADIVDRCLERDWRPRFAEHDLDAASAWSAARA